MKKNFFLAELVVLVIALLFCGCLSQLTLDPAAPAETGISILAFWK